MPKTHTHTTYSYEELSQEAKAKAAEAVRDQLAGPWWDETDNEAISGTIAFALAEKFETPSREEHGEGDFPGIDGIETEWQSAPWYLKLSGYLTPKTAPALPWPPEAQQYAFPSRDNSAYLEVEKRAGYSSWTEQIEPPADLAEGISNAIDYALNAGLDSHDYKTSEEYARDWIDGNDPLFNEDGTLHT